MSSAWDGFYMCLREVSGMPVSSETMKTNWTDDETGSTLGIAWPSLRMGIAFETDNYDRKGMEKAGWKIFRLNTSVIMASESLLSTLYEMALEKELQHSINKAHMTVSKIENRFLKKMLEAGIPMPDRNHKIYNEDTHKLITVPDFAWRKIGETVVKVAVEVDGVYWHALKDNDDLIKRYAEDSKSKRNGIDQKVKIAHKHDSEKRREMQARGWRVIPVSTEDLEENMDEVVKDVKKILRERGRELAKTSDADLINLHREKK